MFGDIGGSEVILILVVILIFFGANKIPELARGLGKGIREFKDASTEIRREFEQAGQPAPPQNYAPQPQYGPQNQYPAPLPVAEAESGSGFDPWASPAYVAPTTVATTPEHPITHKTEEPAPPVASQLPPNLAPEGTQPRQPYIPANASPSADA
jgi:sec-independent protein translocase protein TatA